jgi:hypothetical protein
MVKLSRPSSQKHRKEQARQQKQKEKATRRLQAKQRRANAESGGGDTPMTLAGIRPGPEPVAALGDAISGHEEPQ